MEEVGEMVLAEVPNAVCDITSPPEGQIAHKNYYCLKLLSTIDWKPTVDLEDRHPPDRRMGKRGAASCRVRRSDTRSSEPPRF